MYTIPAPNRLLLILLCLLSVAGSLYAAPPADYAFTNLTLAMQSGAHEKKPIFLYFGRYGCSTCRKMNSEVFTDKELKDSFSDHFVLAYVDTESSNRISLPSGESTTEMQFAARSRILGTPTFIYIDTQNKPVIREAGFQSIGQMLAYNRFVSEGHYLRHSLKDFMAVQ